MSATNISAQKLRELHKPGSPLLIANVYDIISAKAIASLPSCHALGSASYAVAASAGLEDDDMDMETNLRAARAIVEVGKQYQKPVTIDFQDGYGNRLEDGIAKLTEMGVAGINLEDFSRESGSMYPIDEATERVKRAFNAASANGVPDFVINARVDELLHDGSVEEAIKRGKAYLAAGAANVFVLGSSKRGGLSKQEIEELCKAFDGKLNVGIGVSSGLSVNDVAKIGVARCSIGPQLQLRAADAIKKIAESYLNM